MLSRPNPGNVRHRLLPGRIGAVVAVWLVAALTGRAELAWLQSRVVLDPPAGASVAVGLFQAVNRGKAPVRVVGVQSGCGCTAATLDRDSIGPGAVATVQATYTVGGRQGRQTVALKVSTEEPAPRTYDLVLEVNIKRFAVVTPEVRVWRIGERASGQRIRLSLANGYRLLAMKSTTHDFSAVIVRQTNDAVDVEVTPQDLWARRTGSVVFTVGQPGQPPIDVTAMLRVE